MYLPSQAGVSPRAVYVIDDDTTVRCSTSFLLTSAGYAPRPFVSATDFLEEAESLVPGCTLLDIRMPQLDGLACLERLPEALKLRFPIVVITGHGDLPSAVRAMKLGARDFLEKPFEDAVLLDILAKLTVELEADIAKEGARERNKALIAALSPRERELLKVLTAGEPTKRAAHLLGISVRTAEMHRANMMDRLGVRTLADAMRIALNAGMALD